MRKSTGDHVHLHTRTNAEELSTDLMPSKFEDRQSDATQDWSLFEKVERAKQEWEATVDALPQLICLVDDRGHIIRANRTIEAWGLGQVVSVRDRDFHELFHAGCVGLFCYLDRFLRHQRASESQTVELEAYDAIVQRHLLIRVQPVVAGNKVALSSTVIVVRDITERKRHEEALRRYTKRLESISEIGEAILAACSPEDIAMAALSRIRHLVPYRQAYVMLSRAESDDFCVLAANANGSLPVQLALSIPAAAFVIPGSDERRPDRFFITDDFLTIADLSRVEQQLVEAGIRSYLSVPLITEGEYIGSLSLGSDSPRALDREHVQIATEVADLLAIAIRQSRLHVKLRHTSAELQRLLQAREEMIQNVSHELRAPLNLIYGYAVLLDNAELGPLTAEQKQAAQIMCRQGDRLRFMVERLLVLRTFDVESLKWVPVNVSAWLHHILQSWDIRATEASIRLELEASDSLPRMLADPDYLEQVITNLLHNAIKFSPSGGVVRLRVRNEASQLVISVADEGIGIAPNQLTRVFERFYQVDGSAQRPFDGMGIGLALCNTIVQAHGGRIWAESAGEGQGSTFYVALPAAPDAYVKTA